MYNQQPMQAPQAAQKDYGAEVVVDGRIVWGGLALQPKRNFTTKQEEIDPKTGQKIMQVSFGLAVPKPNPQSTPEGAANFTNLWTAIHTEGAKQGFQYPNPKFAWKFDDGDGRKDDGSEFPETYKGCIVLKLSTRLPLNLFKRNPDGSYVQITPEQIKAGDYVRVNLSIKGHPAPNPGLYMNPAGVAFLGYGDAIVTTAQDPKNMFGAGPFNMPQGASSTPIGTNVQFPQAQQPMQAPQFGGMQQPQAYPQNPQGFPQAQQPMVPQFGQAPAQYPQQPAQPQVDPNWNVMPQQFQQQQQAQQPQQQWGQAPMGNVVQPAMQQPIPGQFGSQPNPTAQTMQQPMGFQGGAVPNAFPSNFGGPQFPGQGGR